MDIQDENVSIQKNQIVEDEKQRMNNSNVCSNCGAMLSEEQSFCHKCGKRIEQSNFEPPALQVVFRKTKNPRASNETRGFLRL